MSGREVSPAERFEDEKRRIIESCFTKRDEDGAYLETYITHIKITEYQNSPTAPPPPSARTPQYEKPRVIIVAVRQSGRVRIHKSKQNTNGTFSIGKSWFLDDLTAIESFTSPTADANSAQWAGNVGFVVTLGKPYYWQAQSDKEKKFFIASIIKIYNKYTGGRSPTLTGFEQTELEQVLGGAQVQQRRQDRPPPPRAGGPLLEPTAKSSNASLASGYNTPLNAQGTPSLQGTPPSLAPGFQERKPSRSPLVPANGTGITGGAASPAQSIDSGRPSQDHQSLRRLASGNKSQDSVAASSIAARSEDAISLRPSTRNGGGPVNGSATGSYGNLEASPGPASSALSAASSVVATPADEKNPPPERKRPPMDPMRPLQVDKNLIPAPLMSPGMRREPMVPPRNVERVASSRKGSFSSSRGGAPPSRDGPPPSRDGPPPSRDGPPPSRDGPAATSTPPSLPPTSAIPPVPVPTPPAENTPPKPPSEPQEETTKPGLAAMMKKKSKGEIAGAFWKAANAASAFKPRPGGAAERLRQKQNEVASEGPDGITSVIPAPPKPVQKPPPAPEPVTPVEPPPRAADRGIPEVKITESGPTSAAGGLNGSKPSIQDLKKQNKKDELEADGDGPDGGAPRRSIIAGNDMKYLATLGIDASSLLDSQTHEFAKWLDYFGWVPGEAMRGRHFDEMRVDLDRELSKAQAGGWLARFQEEDERVEAIKRGIDVAVEECEELDNLLTLYSVELSTLADDIAYIEAQGQGLQVQAANQKLLRKELESLLETCAISEADLGALKSAPLETATGVEEIEMSLVTLFKAMTKMDPTLGGTGNGTARKSEDHLGLDSDYGQMRIVQEKKEMYLAESAQFMRRLVIFMERQFSEAFRATKAALDGALSKKADARNHEPGRDLLWMYSPLVLYARDVDLDNWNRILQIYQDKCHPIYKTEFKDATEAWKRGVRKPATVAEEGAELLFTAQAEKKEEGLATTARKLTVKRSQTLARSLRSPLGDSSSSNAADSNNKAHDGRPLPYEVFAGVLDDLLPLVEMEQNFVVDFFHATTLEQSDFPDLVVASRPHDRRGGDLKRHRLMEPDRELARRVTKAMESIFLFLEANLQRLMEWALAMDPLQGVGVLATLERKMAEMSQSNQDFLNNVLAKLHGHLETRFRKFVDDQVRAIEETKVKIKKRKGVIHFIRIFPNFSAAVENMLASIDPSLPVRRMVDREYDRLLKSMFDSLRVIARENPALGGLSAPTTTSTSTSTSTFSTLTSHIPMGANSSSTDPEDKEALNFHILLIENMNHFLEETPNPHRLEVLDDWRETAQRQLAEHTSLYLHAVMRRPLGKLLEHLENIEAQLSQGGAGGKPGSAIAAQPSNSKAVFNKVLGGYDGREVRKGIEALRKRVEKHFGDEEEDAAGRKVPGLPGAGSGVGGAGGGSGGSGGGANSSLVNRITRECERFYADVEMRVGRVTTDVYGGDVLFEWPRAEVRAAFAGR
ncbi:exocyst complex component Sec3-domain-containing protein [Chaetomium sp. MPI-SDFR-AT-0129]|nr:exocyst complex component Sec3-domain-containing protein [Chaetomium sp. MPI-SDFR-AT-0129]